MENNDVLKSKLIALLKERDVHKTSFEIFAEQLLKLDITRLTFDALKNEMTFYTKNQFIYSKIQTKLIEAQTQSRWILGENLEISRLTHAIERLDAGEIPSTDFHREIFAAGVIFCSVYLIQRKIYYMGQDGNHYLENY